ncbi:MAG: fimbrial biogenesis outer membrane usher protein, partial [Brevundimonas sp.]
MTFTYLAAALIGLTPSSIEALADRTLVLEVILNGRATGRVAEFHERNGALYARPSDLNGLGLVLSPTLNDEPIALSTVAGLRVLIDQPGQRLIMAAENSALQPAEVRNGTATTLAPLTASEAGAVLNYDVLATLTDGRVDGGALIDGRVFGAYGVLQSTGLANFTPNAGQRGFVRLDTTYTFSEPGKMRRWRAGDVVSGALGWSRAVRLGGVQISSDFNLRPDLITYPLPTISSSAAVPSTVNILVDGVRQFSQQVQSGPFVVRTLPVVTGAGEVAVAVEDAVGRQTLITLPFYASATLLTPGLASYSAELGSIRRDYGLATDRYSGWAANGAVRYGLFDQLTVEAHGEATEGLALAGIGAAWRVRTLGVVNASVSASTGLGGLDAVAGEATGGGSASLGFQRRSRGFNFNLSGSVASDGYRDLAAVSGAPAPHSTLNASFGRQLGSYGSLGVAYVSQHARPAVYGPSLVGVGVDPRRSVRTELVTVGYSVPIAGRVTLRASGFRDLRRADTYGLGLSLSMTFGAST